VLEAGPLGEAYGMALRLARLRRPGLPFELVEADDGEAHARESTSTSEPGPTLVPMLPPIENRDPGDETRDDD